MVLIMKKISDLTNNFSKQKYKENHRGIESFLEQKVLNCYTIIFILHYLEIYFSNSIFVLYCLIYYSKTDFAIFFSLFNLLLKFIK